MSRPLTDMSSPTSFPFLKLPREVRFMIFKELLVNCQCLGDKPHCHVYSEIAFTCREVFKEVRYAYRLYRADQHVHVNIHQQNILIYLPVPRPLNLVWVSHRSGSFPALLSSFKNVIVSIGPSVETLNTIFDNAKLCFGLRLYTWHLRSRKILLQSVNLRIALPDRIFEQTCARILNHAMVMKLLVNGKEASQ